MLKLKSYVVICLRFGDKYLKLSINILKPEYAVIDEPLTHNSFNL